MFWRIDSLYSPFIHEIPQKWRETFAISRFNNFLTVLEDDTGNFLTIQLINSALEPELCLTDFDTVRVKGYNNFVNLQFCDLDLTILIIVNWII